MRVGLLIDYRLRVRGTPLRWRSEITAWEPPHRFVDEERRGPYRLWQHEHLFEERDGGTSRLPGALRRARRRVDQLVARAAQRGANIRVSHEEAARALPTAGVKTVWILGDQLLTEHAALGRTQPGESRVLMIESKARLGIRKMSNYCAGCCLSPKGGACPLIHRAAFGRGAARDRWRLVETDGIEP